MRGVTVLQAFSEPVPGEDDAGALRQFVAELVSQATASAQHAFEAGREYERSLQGARQAPRRARRAASHQPFILTRVK